MNDPVRTAFEKQVVVLPIGFIFPRKAVTDRQRKFVKFRRIARSVAEVGIIEPLVVSRMNRKDKRFLLLDGHLRLAALKDLGRHEARCLIAEDDEAFTYNKRVNRLATVQEHFMIMRALKNGVSETKLAKALDVNLQHIKRRQTLLTGICPEVIDMLKDKTVNPVTFDMLRKMKPMRQIEAAELMESTANWTASYARALLAATRQDDLAKPERPKKVAGMTREQMGRMEREMAALQQDFRQIEDSYGNDILHLVIATGYLSKLVSNREVARYLKQHHAELLEEFVAIISASSLDQAGIAA